MAAESTGKSKLAQFRVSVPQSLHEALEAASVDGFGSQLCDMSDISDLLIMSQIPLAGESYDSTSFLNRSLLAGDILRRYRERDVITKGELATDLPEAGIDLLRLGSYRPETEQPLSGGFDKKHNGMDLGDSAEQVWNSSRGYWRASGTSEYLVPSRFGFCPYVFRISGWTRVSKNSVYATGGWLIDVESEKLIPVGDTTSVREVTSEDISIASLITNKVIALGNRQPNPVVRLKLRGPVAS